MKIEYYYGCTSSGISVDGQHLSDEPDRQKMLEIATAILNSLEDSVLEYTLKDLIQMNSKDQEDHGRCDQCGDYPMTYKLEV